MVETTTPVQAVDGQTQFGNARTFDSPDCIFVFKNTLSDYEEPPSDEEVSTLPILLRLSTALSVNNDIIKERERDKNENENTTYQ